MKLNFLFRRAVFLLPFFLLPLSSKVSALPKPMCDVTAHIKHGIGKLLGNYLALPEPECLPAKCLHKQSPGHKCGNCSEKPREGSQCGGTGGPPFTPVGYEPCWKYQCEDSKQSPKDGPYYGGPNGPSGAPGSGGYRPPGNGGPWSPVGGPQYGSSNGPSQTLVSGRYRPPGNGAWGPEGGPQYGGPNRPSGTPGSGGYSKPGQGANSQGPEYLGPNGPSQAPGNGGTNQQSPGGDPPYVGPSWPSEASGSDGYRPPRNGGPSGGPNYLSGPPGFGVWFPPFSRGNGGNEKSRGSKKKCRARGSVNRPSGAPGSGGSRPQEKGTNQPGDDPQYECSSEESGPPHKDQSGEKSLEFNWTGFGDWSGFGSKSKIEKSSGSKKISRASGSAKCGLQGKGCKTKNCGEEQQTSYTKITKQKMSKSMNFEYSHNNQICF